jgi:hypothetical protein
LSDGADSRGAYGLQLAGLQPEVRDTLVRAPAHWPMVEIEQRIGRLDPEPAEITEDWVRIVPADGGQILVDRRSRRVTFVNPRPVDADKLVHPTLGAICAVFSSWLGRHAIHAGAFVVDGEAWALIGVSQAGKSSTLGWLVQAGIQILADDLVVIDDGTAFAAPRTLDLVPSSARHLETDGHPVRDCERRRIALGPVDCEVPIRGWIALGWGDALEVRAIRPAERLQVLLEHLRIPLEGPGSASFLDLAALPGFEVRRPRRLEALSATGARVIEVVTGAA